MHFNTLNLFICSYACATYFEHNCSTLYNRYILSKGAAQSSRYFSLYLHKPRSSSLTSTGRFSFFYRIKGSATNQRVSFNADIRDGKVNTRASWHNACGIFTFYTMDSLQICAKNVCRLKHHDGVVYLHQHHLAHICVHTRVVLACRYTHCCCQLTETN